MIRFACPACGKHLKVADQGAGVKVSCPDCGQRLLVPLPTPATPPGQADVLEEVPATPPPVPMAECPAKEGAIVGRVACTLLGASAGGTLGVLAGCVVGFFAAHHFAFFGGINQAIHGAQARS
jgi:DNA-directed RNA polymerase subunit RPC12/RpoP